uniref:Transposase n=1 Tax=Caenorhabditis japonica TaxID=281687 RepID=A0A8R1I1D7_CAEJA
MAIIRGRQMGLHMPTLAKQFKTSKSVIWATLNTPNQSKATGRPLKTSIGDDRIIVSMSKKNPRLTSTNINSELKDQYGVQDSVQGHCQKTSAPRETLQKAPRKQANDSGEEPFSSTEVGKGSSALEWNKFPTVKHCGGNVMVWGCFHANGVGPLIRITEIMNRYMYKDIMEKEMIPSGKSQMGHGWLFQQDNDPKHTSHFVKDWFAQHRANEVLGRRLKNKTAKKLYREVRATQGRMDQDPTSDPDEFDRVHAKRCEAVIKAKGMAIEY